MFRHERPQAGRLRQFYQIGAEMLGSQAPLVDVELLALLNDLFSSLEIPTLALEINTVGCETCRPNFKKALQGFLRDFITVLCLNCQRRIDTNPLRVLDCKEEGCRKITKSAPSIQSYLCPSCKPHFNTVLDGLSHLEISYQINPRLVRGLDYYTKTAFEFTSTSLGAQNAVAAGGRYDGLVQTLGGPETPGIGFALGMERLVSLVKKEKISPTSLSCFIAVLGEKAQKTALSIATQLRTNGFRVEMEHQNTSLKSQMRRANKLGARYVVILGEDELQRGKVTLRNMGNKEQNEIEIKDLSAILAKES
jgi:histidyl-tRNA synthetase